MKSKQIEATRGGIIDVWNAFMVEGALFGEHDIPFCPTTATANPKELISWTEAKRLHCSFMRQGNKNYKIDAFVHFYVDDIKFDGVKSSIWLFPWKCYDIIKHFHGIITPDFSMFQDFPEALKIFAVYQMRAFGFWLGSLGVQVINNLRWGTVGSEELIESMRKNGWKGDPIDVVSMKDGQLTTLDNTRVVAAREANIEVKARVHKFDDPLPDEKTAIRFTTKRGGIPKTWGDAVINRINKQSSGFRKENPNGSYNMKKKK